jgi:hypothetical protein
VEHSHIQVLSSRISNPHGIHSLIDQSPPIPLSRGPGFARRLPHCPKSPRGPRPRPQLYSLAQNRNGWPVEGGYNSTLGISSCWSHRSSHCKCTRVPFRHVSTHICCPKTIETTLETLVSKPQFLVHLSRSLTFLSISRVKTRLQVQVKRKPTDTAPTGVDATHYTSTWDAISKIVADDGIIGLYTGINGALIGVASTNFAYFYWYSVVRTLYISSQKVSSPPSTVVELSLGAVAGAVAQVFTIPVAVITTRQQTQGKGEKKGMVDTARDVINSDDGWSGLWRGLKASLVLVVNPAITYGAYQRLREILFPGKLNLRPWESFCTYFICIMSAHSLINPFCSTWSHVEIIGNDCNPTAHCCQSWTSIKTTSIPGRETVQELH